jgi:hypothetical protein
MVFTDTQTAATAAAVITAPLQTAPVPVPGKYLNKPFTLQPLLFFFYLQDFNVKVIG